MADRLIIQVNRQPHVVETRSDTPLLQVLRNEVGLNSPQYGCALEQCGACTVLIGTKAMPSCKLPVSAITAPITTLEGLRTPEELHPVQRAFIEEQAAQCGFCTNGMMMEAAALVWKNHHPTDAQIRTALDGHLCRCGTHLRVLRAVKRSAALMWGEAE